MILMGVLLLLPCTCSLDWLEGYTGVADIDYDVLVTTLSGTILTKPKKHV